MTILDDDLGEIRLVKNIRAKRIIVRRKEDYLQLTYPPSLDISFIEKKVQEMKPKLRSLIESKKTQVLFTPKTDFETFSFNLKIIESHSTENYYVRLKEGLLSISCPVGVNFQEPSTQSILKGFIEKALRYEANRLLPEKVSFFAKEHGFKYTGVKINKSRTRWGSCSSKKNINLSYYCMLLSEQLLDFVILHELCHTVEMNHRERFWELLNKVSGGKSDKLTRELKLFRTVL